MTLNPRDYPTLRLPETIQPTMVVVIDTEEEFDWSAPFSREARDTENMREMWRLQRVFERHGVVPLYVIDYPIAQDDASVSWLRERRDEGNCEVGAHLHPWVTPPYEEAVSPRNSYGCNLAPRIEHRKIAALTAAIEEAFDAPPVGFRAGRYGVGAQTFASLAMLGYDLDLSLPPNSSFRSDGGPSFYGWSNLPFWADRSCDLLSLPVTTGFSGHLRTVGPMAARLLTSRTASRLHLPGLLARAGLMERARLTPEGQSLAEIERLLDALIGDDIRLVTLSLHSSTMLPGATCYARSAHERDALLDRTDATLSLFRERFDGVFSSASAVAARLRAAENPSVCQALSARL